MRRHVDGLATGSSSSNVVEIVAIAGAASISASELSVHRAITRRVTTRYCAHL